MPGKARKESKRTLRVVYPESQRFACRDCPARCCQTPWGIAVDDDEKARILGDEEAVARLDHRALDVIKKGVLPMRDTGDGLACVFLDDDMLCSLHKRHGHAFIPANCQSYPFGFSKNEDGESVALLSRYCPSIRDNYGESVSTVIEEKLAQVGGAQAMAEKMGLRSGRTLARTHYARVVREWTEILKSGSLPEALSAVFDFTDRIDEALPKKKDLGKEEVEAALTAAHERTVREPIAARPRLDFNARIFFGYLLGGLCYPSRVMHAHRVTAVTYWESVRSWGNRLAWFFGWGTARLIFVNNPVAPGRVARVAPVLTAEGGDLVRGFLIEVLQRRQGMSSQTYLHRVVVDLALMTVLISRYARAAASAEGLSAATAAHVKEGIGVAELLFTHQGGANLTVLDQLRYKLMTGRSDFRRLLAHEV